MKRFIYSLLFCSFLIPSFAQPYGAKYGKASEPTITGKITGTLLDQKDNIPIEYATVAITDANGKVISGALTTTGGSFKIQELPIAKYTVVFSFVGYEKRSVEVELTPRNPDQDLENVFLVPDVKALDEIVIEGKREVYESKIDRLVYNAEQDIGNTGGDASDVLRRTPLLSVDLEGNVSLRGSSNVQILINGKPSSMFSTNPGDALSMIPSDQIKSVEVITSPSAKYDGEGTAGIINIITKKSGPEGFTGNVNLSIGNLNNRGNAGLTVGKGRFGFNASGSSYWSVPRDATSSLYREDILEEQSRLLKENGVQETQRIGFFANAGAFYDFNAYNSLTTSFRLRGFASDRVGNYSTTYDDPILNVNQEYDRFTDNSTLFSGYEWSMDYIHKFAGNDKRELSISYKIDGNIQDQNSKIRQEDLTSSNDPSLFRNEQNINDGNNQETTYQADYTHPFNDKIKLETGFKAIIRDIESDFNFDTLNRTTNSYLEVNNRTDIFYYDQNVYAGYISSQFSLPGDIGVIAGVRYETTELGGSFRDQELLFNNTYQNILPSITVSKTIKNTTTLKGSYARRIQRPGLRQINPFRQLDNNRLVTFGNPELEPELSDQFEISFNTFKKGTVINVSVFYRKTTDLIESIRQSTNTDVAEITYFNVGTNNSVGINTFTSTKLFNIVTLRAGINVFTYDATGEVNGNALSNTALLFNANGGGSIQLPKDWTIEGFGFYRAPRQTIQGFNPSFSIWSLTLQKKIWEERGKIGVRVVEPLVANKSFGSELSGDDFYQISDFTIPFRSFGITFAYKFGKMDFKQRERRSKINNTDQEGVSEPNF